MSIDPAAHLYQASEPDRGTDTDTQDTR
jgi:hypothetical protein